MTTAIAPDEFLRLLEPLGSTTWFGVPDSVLAPLIGHAGGPTTTICANEGAAIAAAAGHFVGTGQTPVVFLQNSGLGNCVNPLLSMAEASLMAVPMVMVVGWRGRPGDTGDEAHHGPQGSATVGLLESMEVPWEVFDGTPESGGRVREFVESAVRDRRPVAVLVPRGTFDDDRSAVPEPVIGSHGVEYDGVFATLLRTLSEPTLFVASAGYGSRSLAAVGNGRAPTGHARLILPGAMGHALAAASSIANARPDVRVVVVQGDGATLMHLGSFAWAGAVAPANLLTIVANNRRHESVGGAPTCAPDLDFASLAAACGFSRVEVVATAAELEKVSGEWELTGGAWCVELLLAPTTSVAPRPRSTLRSDVDGVIGWLRCS